MKHVTKYWTAITYLEGIDPLYMAERLEYARCYYAYIVHDKDVNEETGELKKPHIHWCIEFTSPHGEEYVCKLFGIAKALPMKRDKQLSYRYLCHLDDKDKYVYPISDVRTNIRDLSRYMVLESDGADESEFSLMDSIQALALNMMTYQEFYTRFPSMLYKACVVQTLVKQFSTGSTLGCISGESDEIVTLPNGQKARRVGQSVVQVISNI